jgi:hypothetical protein
MKDRDVDGKKIMLYVKDIYLLSISWDLSG